MRKSAAAPLVPFRSLCWRTSSDSPDRGRKIWKQNARWSPKPKGGPMGGQGGYNVSIARCCFSNRFKGASRMPPEKAGVKGYLSGCIPASVKEPGERGDGVLNSA
nr:hypothetical protein CFP56_12088 [Quercus suber]